MTSDQDAREEMLLNISLNPHRAGEWSVPLLTGWQVAINERKARMEQMESHVLVDPDDWREMELTIERQAVEIDPDFGLGWLALANASNLARIVLSSDQLEDVMSSRDLALEQARRVAPDMPQLLLADANQHLVEGNWLEAETILLALLEQNDALTAQINSSYGSFLQSVGRAEDAIPYLSRAKRLNPLAPGIAHSLSVVNLMLGRTDEAVAEADRGIGLGSAFNNTFFLAIKSFAAYMDDDPALAAELVRAGGAPPGELYVEVADLLAGGEHDAVLETIRAGIRDDMSALEKVALATPAALAGDPELAVELYLGVSAGTPFTFGIITTWTSLNREIRQQPEFRELVVRTGLLDYWRTSGKWADVCYPLNDGFACD